MKIEILSGSPREKSTSLRLAKHLHKQFTETTAHTVGLLDMREIHLPPLQVVYSSVAAVPDNLKPIVERVFAADGFILVTPEYNGSYASSMKDFLDRFPKQHHKPFGIVTASPGALGGIRASQQVLLLVAALFGIASPYMLVVPQVDKKFDEEGNIVEKAFESTVHQFVKEFTWLAESITSKK